ncbi:MAG: PIN domain-containing protein [Bacteroidota bacterium]
MNDKVFLDSNVLVYCYSTSDSSKQIIARNLSAMSNVHISTQVLNETTNVLHKKYHIPWNDLANLITDFESNFILHTLTSSEIKKACIIAKQYGFSFYDSLIIAAALICDCDILYSEDMQHNQIIENKLKIVNPFKGE